MPIRPEWRYLYRGAEYRERRARLLDRAGHVCQNCGKPNRKMVWTVSGKLCCTRHVSPSSWGRPAMAWSVDGKRGWWNERGMPATNGEIRFGIGLKNLRQIEVVLTMAHLNHNPADNRDENLRMLCQYCHLNYDKLHHAETRGARKDAARPLLAGVA